MPIKKAIIPAAGLGTRFLPATKVIPKEMIPVIDRPGIQYAVEEAARAGIDDIVIVGARGKGAIEDHFDAAPDLERRLERDGKTEELESIRAVTQLARIFAVRQKFQRGFGDAVLAAKGHVGDEPCAVLVPDEIVPAGQVEDLLPAMIDVFDDKGASVVAVQEVPHDQISAYGAIVPGDREGAVVEILDMVEKPSVDTAPSDLAARGRYVFTPEIFPAIESTTEGYGGEIQLTDAIRIVIKEHGAFAYVYDGDMLDVGNKLGYLEATVELALSRPDLAEPFERWLRRRLELD
ncbi:MAG: UTP--glucose-phosphate uridylyltransferase [Actinomycetota bacterium]|jgi:UTP--glucose-1-phosphate uridylyltransferase|nr:UTP--glucose-phosphate uridylyltransferase [Actinomycetota bacterium]